MLVVLVVDWSVMEAWGRECEEKGKVVVVEEGKRRGKRERERGD